MHGKAHESFYIRVGCVARHDAHTKARLHDEPGCNNGCDAKQDCAGDCRLCFEYGGDDDDVHPGIDDANDVVHCPADESFVVDRWCFGNGPVNKLTARYGGKPAPCYSPVGGLLFESVFEYQCPQVDDHCGEYSHEQYLQYVVHWFMDSSPFVAAVIVTVVFLSVGNDCL